jgi:ABC-type uncharacterized transport system permease subunit
MSPLTDRWAIACGTAFYAAGLLYGCWSVLHRRRHSRVTSYSFMLLGWLLQTYGLYLRGQATHSCPIGNTFELVQFVAWSCTLIYLAVGAAFRTSLLGFFSAGMAVLLGTMSLAIPEWDSGLRIRPFGGDPVVAIHASLGLFSYGVFALLALTSLMFLVQHRNLRQKRSGGAFALLPSIVELDHMNLRLLACGVVLLSIALGIAGHHWHGHPAAVAPAKLVVTGAVWLFYVATLAQRLRQHWVGQRFASVCLALFLAPLLSLGIVSSPHRPPAHPVTTPPVSAP